LAVPPPGARWALRRRPPCAAALWWAWVALRRWAARPSELVKSRCVV